MQPLTLKGPDKVDQYQSLSYLDNGGMGNIYTAIDTHNNRPVAIKIIRIINVEDRGLLEQEFKIASNLSHENLIETYYYGEFSDNTGNFFYSATEFCPSGNLQKKISNNGQLLSISECLNFFYDLLRGLQEAHKFIVHRDLKPGNILIGDTGKLKICDFGIAKYLHHLTRSHTFKGAGTFPYMAPECWTGNDNTIQMDIYSLGIVFFEILTGKLPFTGSSETEIREHHLFSNLPSLSNFRNDVPVTISEIIRKMTNKRLGERYKNVVEIIAAFDSVTEISNENSSKINILLNNVHRKINTMAEEELKLKKAHGAIVQKQRALSYSIEQLFDQFLSVASKVNKSIVDSQITHKIVPAQPNNPASSILHLYFFEVALSVTFYAWDLIANHIVLSKHRHIERQMQEYAMKMHDPTPKHLEIDNAAFLGKAELSVSRDRAFGFNLMLRKESNDIYGEWWICKFQNRVQTHDAKSIPYFGFEPTDFFKYYEVGRTNVMDRYRMVFNKLAEDDIIDLIDKMTI